MINLTETQLRNGNNCTMLPYDYTLMPVHKKALLDVAAANVFKYDTLEYPKEIAKRSFGWRSENRQAHYWLHRI